MAQEPSQIVHLPSTDPQFLSRVFIRLLQSQSDHPLVQLFDLQREAYLSYFFDLSGIQESFRFRALNRARRLALALVDEKGDIKRGFLKEITSLYEKEGEIFYPEGTGDCLIYDQILRILKALNDDEWIRSFKRFQKPLCHKWAERLVFETLGIFTPSNGPTNAEIRAAVLCACFTPLRQNVGSCFATAPAILIQREQPRLFIDDLYQLLSTGQLKRTFGGIEYAVPLSPSTGIGDLKKNLITGDSTRKAGFCPGLIESMVAIGAMDGGMSIEDQGKKLQDILSMYGSGMSKLTGEDLIRKILMEKLFLNEEDVKKLHELEVAQLKSSKMSLPPDLKMSRQLEKIHTFKQKEKEARSIFKGICDNALLKTWEFTLASFSEVKMEFSRWNLYSSLGLAPHEPGGIGELIYNIIDEKIEEINPKIEEYQRQYEIAFDQVRGTEALLRRASSESEIRRLQAEYQARVHQMHSCLEMRDRVYAQGSRYSTLFSFLIKQYDQKFPEYFQEIYDAEMQDFQGDLYEDSPAGFRLVYKHGRSDPSLWTLIDNADQYIDALLDFFSATESQIAAACEWEGGEKEILVLTSAIIAHIQSEIFLETAMQRMAKVHRTTPPPSSLKTIRSLDKKPWAYISGGTLTTLLKTYFCRENELTLEEKWVENESELLIFLLDILKNLPPKISEPFLEDKRRGMLITSPSHAFVFLPGQDKMRQGWQENIFTYTWVRDEVFLPSQRFYANMPLNPAEQSFLLQAFCQHLSPLSKAHLNQTFFSFDKPLSISEWRNHVLHVLLSQTQSISGQPQALADTLDAFLFQVLPLTSGKEWKVIVRHMLSDKMDEKVEKILHLFPDIPCTFMTAKEIRETAKGCYLLAQGHITLSFDLHQYIADHARFVGNAQPTALLFADTNWTNYFFGFVINPGTLRLELWRLDPTMTCGVPMSSWKQWLNGTDRKTWSVLTRPFEYCLYADKTEKLIYG